MPPLPDPRLVVERARAGGWSLRAADGSLRLGLVRSLAAVVALVLVAALGAAMTGGDGEEAAEVTEAPPVEGPLLWKATSVSVEAVEVVGVAQPPDLQGEVDRVVDAVERYVKSATEEPLLTGEPSAVLPSLFTAAAGARLDTHDRAVLTDESLPAVTALAVGPVTAKVTLLTGSGGRAEVAVVDLTVTAHGFGGSAGGLAVDRRGELVLLPAEGGWQIDSYRLDLEVSSDGLPPFGLVLWPFGGSPAGGAGAAA